MTKYRMLLPLIAGLASAGGSLVRAADEPRLTGQTEIHLTQQAERKIARDRIEADLRIEAGGTEGPKIQAEINRRMTEALAKAKTYRSVEIRAGFYSVYRDDDPKAPQPWRASQSITLTSSDFGALIALVGALQGDGLLVSHIRPFLAPETLRAVQADMTSEALKAVGQRARRVAEDLGTAVDHYQRLMIGNVMEQGGPVAPMMMMARSPNPAAAPPPAFEPGDSVVTLTVSADVVLKPGRGP